MFLRKCRFIGHQELSHLSRPAKNQISLFRGCSGGHFLRKSRSPVTVCIRPVVGLRMVNHRYCRRLKVWHTLCGGNQADPACLDGCTQKVCNENHGGHFLRKSRSLATVCIRQVVSLGMGLHTVQFLQPQAAQGSTARLRRKCLRLRAGLALGTLHRVICNTVRLRGEIESEDPGASNGAARRNEIIWRNCSNIFH